MIKAITFDLDGVYFPDGKQKFVEAIAGLGVTPEDAARVFLDSPEMNDQYKTGKMTDEQFWSWAARQWGISETPKELVDQLISSYSPDENVASAVCQARKAGYRTLVCSNNFPARVNGLQERFGFLDDFDAAVFSYEVGVTKPDKAIFERLIQEAGVEPESIVFADDKQSNVDAAKLLGITTFAFSGFDMFISQLQDLGVNLAA